MKRTMLSFVLCLLLFSLLISTAVYADEISETVKLSDEILYGSPYIDGIIDAEYHSSYALSVTDKSFFRWGSAENSTDETGSTAIARFLWDEQFLYVCVEVSDAALMTVGKEQAPLTWENDCITVWFCDNGKTFRVQADPFGYVFAAGDGQPTVKMENAVCAARINAERNRYVIEMALPFSDLASMRILGISLQLNDMTAEDGGVSYASSVICMQNLLTLSETPASAETEAPDTNPSSPDSPGAQTSDAILIASIAALVAVILILLLLRRRP